MAVTPCFGASRAPGGRPPPWSSQALLYFDFQRFALEALGDRLQPLPIMVVEQKAKDARLLGFAPERGRASAIPEDSLAHPCRTYNREEGSNYFVIGISPVRGDQPRCALLVGVVDRSEQLFEHRRLVDRDGVAKAAPETVEIRLGEQAHRHDLIVVSHHSSPRNILIVQERTKSRGVPVVSARFAQSAVIVSIS